MKKLRLFILLASVACQSNPGLPVLTDDRTSGVDPIIEALRSYQNFPMVYVQQDSLVYKFFNEEEARADYESNLKTRQQKTGSTLQSLLGSEIVEKTWFETTTPYNPSLHGSVPFRVYSASTGIRSAALHKYLEIPAYNDWAGAFMFLATGVGADYHNKNVHNLWMTGVLKYADGSLGGNVRFTTANYGEENTFEVMAELAQTLIPRRVVIGYGFRLKDSKFKTLWLYTAPYNAAARRVVINEVDDVVIYVPYSKHVDRPTDNPQMIVRTFDYCDQHQQLVRAFVTGIGMTTNSSTVTRLGIQITTVN